VLFDLVLAGDNAVVIALAVRTLPRRQQLYGRIWGTAGAVILRLVFIAVVSYLLAVPFLQIVGGLLLLWIAFKLVRQEEAHVDAHGGIREGTTLMQGIWIIVVADVVMSLDNVLAIAAAADGDIRLVVFGIALSIPIVVFLSGVLATLMNRYPWIILVAAGLLGEVAGKMILEDHFVRSQFGHVPTPVEWAVRAGLFVAVIAIARYMTRARETARE